MNRGVPANEGGITRRNLSRRWALRVRHKADIPRDMSSRSARHLVMRSWRQPQAGATTGRLVSANVLSSPKTTSVIASSDAELSTKAGRFDGLRSSPVVAALALVAEGY